MATNIDIVVTDLTGYNFIVKLNWDLDCIKQSISTHYETKIFNEYLTINNISRNEYYKNSNYTFKWMESEFYKRVNDYYYNNIELIYNDKILEQYHVETDQFDLSDIKNNNNMSFVITKKESINLECRDDYDVYSNGSD